MQSRPSQLPAGPRLPKALQTVGWWTRPIAFLEQCPAPCRKPVATP